ncbi:MAG: hypothetical protein ACO4AC_10980, partial [Pseudohongiellaceae bacterium]
MKHGKPVQEINILFLNRNWSPFMKLHLLPAALTLSLGISEVKAAEEEIVEVLITGEAKDTYDVLPDRETDSIFGNSKSIDEIPRSITLVES